MPADRAFIKNDEVAAMQPITSSGHTRYSMHPPEPAHDQWPPSAPTSIHAATPRMASRLRSTYHPNPAAMASTLPLYGRPQNGHHPNLAGFHFNIRMEVRKLQRCFSLVSCASRTFCRYNLSGTRHLTSASHQSDNRPITFVLQVDDCVPVDKVHE
jgi:hypothetical protein